MADSLPPFLLGRCPQIAAGGEFTPQAKQMSRLRRFVAEERDGTIARSGTETETETGTGKGCYP
jgi:hypothetical protein